MRRASRFCLATERLFSRVLDTVLLCAAVLLCAGLPACGGNSCAIFVWNGGTTVAGGSPCPFAQGSGTANLRITTSFALATGPTSPNLQHLYITLRGIQAHPTATAGDSSTDWQELSPELAQHPVQVDLLERGGTSSVTHWTGRSVVPADVYDEIRLRFAPHAAAEDDPTPEQNACGNAGLNCVVTTGGEIRPLIFNGAEPDFLIGTDDLSGGFFRVLPNHENYLSIEFSASASLAVAAAGGRVEVVPVFTASSEENWDSAAAPAQKPQN
jgi:hypothetical protein